MVTRPIAEEVTNCNANHHGPLSWGGGAVGREMTSDSSPQPAARNRGHTAGAGSPHAWGAPVIRHRFDDQGGPMYSVAIVQFDQ